MTARVWILSCVLCGLLLFVVAGHCGCVSGRPGATDLAAFASEQQVCVRDNETRAAIDACRATSRFHWCVKWPDEANCPARGGAPQ